MLALLSHIPHPIPQPPPAPPARTREFPAPLSAPCATRARRLPKTALLVAMRAALAPRQALALLSALHAQQVLPRLLCPRSALLALQALLLQPLARSPVPNAAKGGSPRTQAPPRASPAPPARHRRWKELRSVSTAKRGNSQRWLARSAAPSAAKAIGPRLGRHHATSATVSSTMLALMTSLRTAGPVRTGLRASEGRTWLPSRPRPGFTGSGQSRQSCTRAAWERRRAPAPNRRMMTQPQS